MTTILPLPLSPQQLSLPGTTQAVKRLVNVTKACTILPLPLSPQQHEVMPMGALGQADNEAAAIFRFCFLFDRRAVSCQKNAQLTQNRSSACHLMSSLGVLSGLMRRHILETALQNQHTNTIRDRINAQERKTIKHGVLQRHGELLNTAETRQSNAAKRNRPSFR